MTQLPTMGGAPADTELTCLFCRFRDEGANRLLDESDHFYARYDNFPATAGHVEIVPKRHVESFFDLRPGEIEDAYALMRRVKERISREHNPLGYTIGVNDGRAAGRTIDHLHIHLIPRYLGDVAEPAGGIRRIFPESDQQSWRTRA
ncbi:HIT family protein [Actinokineospora auranticolor]|uniref:Diadenosine tetraphosphate (Ap4A) HIT family hydrolase n=1 Tax=Actinokineospora auranticolor TaxID=155976 RepID=A0A2S6GWB5_9PSEU|nr:HIT family protein [Actinokineospora auranticolor]PPK69486.1 diadenosine tetraphosphate (Ap4A) HIT family hydrolase [Actinokineospora auranticolor]